MFGSTGDGLILCVSLGQDTGKPERSPVGFSLASTKSEWKTGRKSPPVSLSQSPGERQLPRASPSGSIYRGANPALHILGSQSPKQQHKRGQQNWVFDNMWAFAVHRVEPGVRVAGEHSISHLSARQPSPKVSISN